MGKDRKIYLLRHGDIYEEGELHRCLGHTDVPLTQKGERQAGKTAKWLQDKDISRIYSSPLQRCVKTAQIIKRQKKNSGQEPEIRILEALQELDAGKWENLSFKKIKEKYPDEYEARGRVLGYYSFPGGESLYQAGLRFGGCLEAIRKKEKGNILIVAHAGVIRGYLSGLLDISPNDIFTISQPYAGITILKETDMRLTVEKIGWRSPEFLDKEEMRYLYRKCKTPERTIRHMEAVAHFLDILVEKMGLSDYDWELLKKAALVHDICRMQGQHAKAGAEVLRKEGYREIAKLVEGHHDCEYFVDIDSGGTSMLSEEELLFYADKRVLEEQVVSLEERFEASMWKCRTLDAKENHHRLYEKAKWIESKIEKKCSGRNQNMEFFKVS